MAMPDRIRLEVITPSRLVAQAEVTEVIAPGADGEFGVLPGHAFYISVLRPGEVRWVENGEVRRFVVGRGFAEVGPDYTTILADFAEDVRALNSAEIQESLTRDEARLKSLPPGEAESTIIVDRIEKNRARLDVASRR